MSDCDGECWIPGAWWACACGYSEGTAVCDELVRFGVEGFRLECGVDDVELEWELEECGAGKERRETG